MNLPKKALFILFALFTVFPFVSSALGLILGLAFALLFSNPFPKETKSWTPRLLQLSVVGLGAQMDLFVIARVGMEGVGYTVVGITLTLFLGFLLNQIIRAEKETALLIGVGTAICGGSAIAAVAPTIKAKSESISVSLACVFLLNSLALLIFPWVGRALHLSQAQFGLWSALAIHDTSSVVGASSEFGQEALEIATTVKLARALWIVPLTLLIGQLVGGKGGGKKPWFILGFLVMAAFFSFFPQFRGIGEDIAFVARRSLVLTLFLIGSALSKEAIRRVGVKPLVLGVLLWVIVSVATLGWIIPQKTEF